MSRPRPEHINLNDVSPESGGGATKAIRRAFFADWVIECGGSRETQNLLSTLGQPLTVIPHPPESSGPAKNATPGRMSRSESMGDLLVEPSTYRPQKLTPTINELLATERNYVHRLRTLKRVYADPLRIFAKDPIACIIPLFVANTLFANIDALVLVNEAFLDDLERAVAGTGELGIGDVAVKHFVQTKKFDCYRTYYDKCEDAQAMFEDQLAKQKVFREFLSASKQKTEGLGGSGLRELLMEPVQRIPRYTLLWKDMIAYMDPLDPQREQLETAIKAARAIAACEKEESTKRMIVMTGIQQNMEGFPAELINNNRDYYDSLDAEDYITDVSVLSPTSSTFPSSSSIPGGTHSSSFSSAGIPSLHCTLILFSDRLLISKRPTGGTSGRRLTGLEDVAKMCKGRIIGGGSAGGGGVRVYGGPGSEKAKDRDAGKLSYKGMVNVLDVIATDVGGGDFQLYLSRPPNDQSERWSGRHFRCYSVVHPPQPITLDPAMSRESKQRFVHNLWAAQALVRARGGRSTAWAAVDEERLEGWGGKLGGRAKGFWNEWDRQSWEEDTSKAKVIVHVDELGGAKPISIGDETRPYLVVRVQPLAGSLSRVSVHTRDNDETAEIIPTNSVTSKVVQTIHQYGVFQHRTESRSCPTTPVHAPHSKRPMLNVGLDAISRNLFGSGSLSGRGGGEGGFSIGSMSHKRTRSAISKSSISEGSVTRSTISSMGRSAGDEGSRSRTNSSVGRKTPELIGGRKTPEPFASAADSTTSPRHLSARKPVPKPEVSAPGKPEHLDQLMDQQSVRARSRSSPEVPTMESVTAAARIASRPSSRPTSPLQVVNKTPVLEKTAMFSSQPRSDPMALDSPTTTSRTRRRSQDSPAPIGGRRRTPVGLRSSSNETGGPISSTSETRRPAGPRSRPTSPSMTSAPTATSTVPFALSLPTPVAAPSPFLVDLSSPAPTDRRAAQQAALGLGSAHTKTRVFSTESSGSRRTSDDWRRRRPSGPLDPSSPVSSPDEPDSPSSTASGRRRRRGQSMEVPSPVLGKKPKREKEDVPPFPLPPSPLPLAGAAPRSPLHALGDVSNGGELPPPVVGSGTDFRKGSSPSRPSGLRKESRSYSSSTLLGSGGGGNKRLATNEKDLEAMTVEERAVARLGLIVNDASVARKGLKRMRLEIDGLRAHINKESAQKSRLDRLTEINTGSLPRSPTSRNITRRAAPGQIGRVEEARLLLEMGAHESNNSSPTKLNGATSISRRPIVDVAFLSTCFETLDGVLGSVSTDVQSLATHVDLLKPDVTTLASSLPPAPAPSMGTLNLQRELEEANALLAQARKISQDRAAELADAKRENATLYEAFNEELEQMYADMTLPGAEAHVAIKRDLATTKADRNKFKLEHMSLSGKVKALEEERERMRADRTRMEALLQSHGLF